MPTTARWHCFRLMKIFLIGFMGSGKTTVGRMLAKELGYVFADTDNHITDLNHLSVHEIFVQKGEGCFREMERDAIREVSRAGDVVVATGGGAPCFFDNMDYMNGAGTTIYLKLTPRGLMKRLEHGRDKRPLLRGKSDAGMLEYIETVLARREQFYSRAAITVDCEGLSDNLTVETIKNTIL